MSWTPVEVVRRNPWLFWVLAVGLIVRAVLIPITHGDDFTVWDLATRATLAGGNIYAHHPDYPHGPYAYFPLFLYLELPMQWLAQHTVLSFLVLGKLPILAADLACAVLIASEIRRRGCSERTAAIGAALFFLNPLVLYNSAYYGRFDTLGCALLLLALRSMGRERTTSWASAIWYGLAVVAKTFPGFVLAGVLHAAGERWRRILVGLLVVAVVISAPYLPSASALGHDAILYNVGKAPRDLSWQHIVTGLFGTGAAKIVSYLMLIAFAVAVVWLRRMPDLARYTAVTLVLFVLTSKVVLEQYLIWPLPWLVLLATRDRSRLATSSLALAGAFTAVGMFDNETYHPLGRSAPLLVVVVTVVSVAYAAVAITAPQATVEQARSAATEGNAARTA